MKYVLLIILSMGTMMPLFARQEGEKTQNGKILTMEEAVLGYELRPQSRYIQWQGNRNMLTYIEGKNLIAEAADGGEKTVLMTLGDLNALLGTDLKGWPQYTWKDAGTLVIVRQRQRMEIDVPGKRIIRVIPLPEKAADLTYNGKDAYAFTRGNNLYYSDERGNEYAVTRDEDPNIVNGQSVSRNEMGIHNGIFWSPDGKKLAFYRKDESQVGTFPLLDITTRTGSLKEIKYPMTGMPSEQISVGVYDLASQRTVFLDVTDFGREQYLTNVTWDPASEMIYLQVVDRAQKQVHLNKYNARNGEFVKTLLEEKNDRWVEPSDPLVFLKNDAGHFLYRTDNRDGYRNLYLCDTEGKSVRRLTDVDADVAYAGQDGRYVYYTSAEVSPVDNHLFRVDVKTGRKTRLTAAEGWHGVNLSKDGKYFVDSYSSLNVPRVIELRQTDGKAVRELLRAENPTKEYNYGEITLGSLKSADGKFDNYYRLIKPMNFDPAKKYPVILYVYGGPHSQMVKNSWQAELRRWEMYMAQHGYV
ncbi:MAG: DPP IV N-terminal domain-containing protein, partial [Odoribacter sp.]|nr:DPP IV N-terminal domain-containing protein [Odoribacter sp.]